MHSEHFEETLFDLLESKSWNELDKEEQTWVLRYLSEEEYTLQRKVLVGAEAAFAGDISFAEMQYAARSIEQQVVENSSAEATSGLTALKKQINLYKSISAVAAIVIVVLLLYPFTEKKIATTGNQELVLRDTIWKRDTVFRELAIQNPQQAGEQQHHVAQLPAHHNSDQPMDTSSKSSTRNCENTQYGKRRTSNMRSELVALAPVDPSFLQNRGVSLANDPVQVDAYAVIQGY